MQSGALAGPQHRRGWGLGAEAGSADPWPWGTDGELGSPPASEAVEAEVLLLGQLCLPDLQPSIRDAAEPQPGLGMTGGRPQHAHGGPQAVGSYPSGVLSQALKKNMRGGAGRGG